MREKFLTFARQPANASKIVAAGSAFYALLCELFGWKAKSFDPATAGVIVSVIMSVIASHLDTRKIEKAREETATARDVAHAANAERIGNLEGTVAVAAQAIGQVAEKTGTEINVPHYTPTPPPAVPADKLREIMEASKRS